MKNIKIVPMDLEKDKPQIAAWDEEFYGSEEYATIEHFILEDNLIHGLSELIETNFERVPIGKDEAKKAFSIKTESGQIAGFLICQVYDMTTPKPTMFLQYIVLHPDFQHLGYGEEVFSTLFSDPKKYLGVKPHEVFAKIDEFNESSLYLFQKFGFMFPCHDPNYPNLLHAEADMKTIEKRLEEIAKHKN